MALPLYTLGLLYLLLITLIWSLSSLLVSSTLPTFPSPLLTWLSTIPFILLLKKEQLVTPDWGIVKLGAKLGATWYLSNLFYYLSLQKTSVTSSTVLSSSSSLFTYLIETRLNKDSYEFKKVLAVLFVIAGAVVSATKGDRSENKSGLEGDLYGLLSALGYSVYTVIVKRYCKDEETEEGEEVYEKVRGDSIDDTLESAEETVSAETTIKVETTTTAKSEEKYNLRQTLGYLGLTTSSLGLFIIPYYAIVGTNVTLTWTILGSIVYVAIIDNLISDFLWAKSVVYTNATVATVGLAMTVPFAVVIDWGEGGGVGWGRVVGSGMVLLGFVGINV
ncbi:hypothetical protein TL16_g06456 [Triparma laevis f. inornata]|uniref:EamA domain-containing protein n=2 Tax=Triparma laevis TaxID=1534972 RepID=A0A9W7C6X7_9STRA|nr:hypothetical protein TL16_g06456 [Triparma laevis f. inornata]GMI00300.1 hypothetical protein TrLO_g11353 [Triparma laevis f. longispina]